MCAANPVRVDEFEISSKAIDKERLATYAFEIKNNPDSQAYILIYSNNKFSSNEIEKKEKYIRDFFVQEKIPDNRLVFIHTRSDKKDWKNYISFWRVPQGAEPPIP